MTYPEGMALFARLRRIFLAALLAVLAGCASTQGGEVADPAEGFNRAMYGFNDGFDQAIAKPVATAYKTVVPDPVQGWVRNFFANIADLFIGLNSLLQGKPGDAANDWGRFVFNSTFGLLGIHDVATEFGLEKNDEDFGQTFGRWGAGEGAYIVWPFLGSSTVRDSIGSLIESSLDPVRRHEPVGARNVLIGTRVIGRRADLLDASRIMEEAALDKYVFQRDAYLQRRRSLINDGQAPRPGADGRRRSQVLGVYEPRVPANYDSVLAASATRDNAR
ncbi:MAG: VacJ family lipoprotein [Proteobacteria bacterium]|nr:VacJ family lipoprotein [Pseudomonadota bacterium]